MYYIFVKFLFINLVESQFKRLLNLLKKLIILICWVKILFLKIKLNNFIPKFINNAS